MKSKIQFLALVLLGILLSINQVWAESPLTLTMNKTAIGNVTSLTNQAKTISGYELYFTSVTSAGNDFVQLAKSSSLYNNTAIPGAISSIKLTNCATTSAKTDGGYTVYGSTNGSSWTEIGSVTGLSSTAADKTTDFTGSYSYFKITVNSARVLKISSIIISYSGGSTYTVLFLYIRHRVARLYRADSYRFIPFTIPVALLTSRYSPIILNFTSHNVKDHRAFKSALLYISTRKKR